MVHFGDNNIVEDHLLRRTIRFIGMNRNRTVSRTEEFVMVRCDLLYANHHPKFVRGKEKHHFKLDRSVMYDVVFFASVK
jgi:hypothetical protein